MPPSDILQDAVQYHQSGDFQRAEKIYRQILARDPAHADANHLLGLLAYQGKFYSEAVDLISKAIASDSSQPIYHNSLGLALKDQGRTEQSVEALTRATSLRPDYTEAHNNLAQVYQDLGNGPKAIDHFRRTLELAPDHLQARGNLGNALIAAGDLEAAVACFQCVLAVQPQLAAAHCSLGVALQGLGQTADAMAAYRKASTIDPSYLEAHINLGLAYQSQGDLDNAEDSFRKCLAVAPDFAEAHSNLGVVLQQKAQPENALRHLHEAIDLAPGHAKAHSNLGAALIELGDAEAALGNFVKALELQPRFPAAHSNLLLARLYLAHTDPAENLLLARQFNSQVHMPDPLPRHRSKDANPDRPLKIGFVSADLRRHAVSSFLETVWPALNSDSIRIYAYATSAIEDETSEKLKKAVTVWRNIAGLAVSRQALTVIDDEIDILVDLGGHTAHNSLDLFALKPAPIQVGWLGYSATTGLATIDYILGDPWVTPVEDRDQYSETIWRMPNSYLCFSPPDISVDTLDTPALADGHIRFGTFNNLTKLTDTTISCWAQILHKVPDSRLLLKAKQLHLPDYRTQLFDRFEARGIAGDRLQLMQRSPRLDTHFASYNQIDIALDTFPYAGTTTTSEALWMGVPVLTLKGDRFVARVGESLLHNCGLDDWIASTKDELVEKAAGFSSDIAALNQIRHTVRHRFLASPACDAPQFAIHMGRAFRDMWQVWCKT